MQVALVALDGVVVTATRSASRVDETLADVTVISRRQLDTQAPGMSLGEVLQSLAGVQFAGNGGRGTAQTVSLRGTGSSHTLLLIDGVRYGSATWGSPALSNLPLEAIERIEVVKGPASALYGSEAIGGVIQIFTQRGQGAGQPLLGQASVTVGGHGHHSASAGLRGEQGAWDYQLRMGRVLEDGISATNARSGYYHHPDRDGLAQTSVSAQVGWQLQPNWRLEGQWQRTDGKADADLGNTGDPFSQMRSQVASLKLQGTLARDWTSSLSVGRSYDDNATIGSAYDDGHFDTTQTEWKWDHQLRTRAGMVLAGLEHLTQEVDAQSLYMPQGYSQTRRSINAAFVGINGSAGRHTWQGNLRRDDNSQFGGFTTYGLGYGFQLLPGWRAYASHGRAMRAPSFNDLYYVESYPAPWNGNPHLKPEQAHNNEVGLEWTQGAHQAKLLHYRNRVSQLIEQGTTQMENVAGTSKLNGWTASYAWQGQGWKLRGSLDALDAQDAHGERLKRRARQQLALHVDKQLGAWTVGGSALRVGSRLDIDENYATTRMPAYTRVDVHARWRINPEWSLLARVVNLTDRDYESTYGFNTLGRTGYLTLQWTMR